MSDPRLSRLASLWHQSLEASLQPFEESELHELLQDAALAEAWVDQQIIREEPGAGMSSAMPRRLKAAFQRQYRPALYWGLRLGLPAMLVALFLAWPRTNPTQSFEAQEDETPFSQVENLVASSPEKPALGPPPGINEAHLWVRHTQKNLYFDITLARAAQVKAQILATDGQRIASIDFGQKPAGKARLQWDAKLPDGRPASFGHYSVIIYVDGILGFRQELSIEKNKF